LFVLLIAVAEFREAFAVRLSAWMRAVLPVALLACGLFLLIWSDHEAWPIGRLTVTETFLGHDHEIIQHKLYGLLLLAVGLIEWLWRTGQLIHRAWVTALPIFAILGGLMLFVHSHGHHPAAEKIAWHHSTMGVLAILAGSCRLAGAGLWVPHDRAATSRWAVAWASLILLIGVQLLSYSE
jgi:putative copper resistance protein D